MISSIFPDANILSLLVIGRVDPKLVGQWARRSRYTAYDFEHARRVVGLYRYTATTPQVLAEVSNLTQNAFHGRYAKLVAESFRDVVSAIDERFFPAHVLTKSPEFADLGLADLSVLRRSGKQCVVLSADEPLCRALWSRGHDAIYFTGSLE